MIGVMGLMSESVCILDCTLRIPSKTVKIRGVLGYSQYNIENVEKRMEGPLQEGRFKPGSIQGAIPFLCSSRFSSLTLTPQQNAPQRACPKRSMRTLASKVSLSLRSSKRERAYLRANF